MKKISQFLFKQVFCRVETRNFFLLVGLFLLLTFLADTSVFGQSLSSLERGRARDMLTAVKNEIKDKYYDTTFHGINMEEEYQVAKEKLDKATSMGQAFGIIAQYVMLLNDSHTRFYPPSRASAVEYGWLMQMIDDKCFVTEVKPKSDAEKQGLKKGDQIIEIEGFKPSRKEFWKMNYYYNVLSPRSGLNLKIKSPNDENPREINVASKITESKAELSLQDLFRRFELEDDTVENRFVKLNRTLVWKLPTFIIEPAAIDNIMNDTVNKYSNLILDLRDNSGGYVVALEQLAGYFVDKDTKIADLKGRKKMDPQVAKTKGDRVFKGRVIVIVNSRSASASEIFARFLQLNERGVVIGDRSAGAVMQSRGVPMQMGVDRILPYGMNMTNADVIMVDSKSLEHTGVTPNLIIVPKGSDLASGRDPVLAAALELFEEKVTAEDAGKYFPFKWKENN